MKKVGIAKISINNPLLTSYVNRINSWDEEKNFKIDDESFYGIFLDDEFLAASTMSYNPNTAHVNILMINGSTQNYDRIEKESTEQLTNIALNTYDAKTVGIDNVKKLVMSK